MAVALFIVLNIADAWLMGLGMGIEGIDLNPLEPPFYANLLARGIIAIGVTLLILLFKKANYIMWLNILMIAILAGHAIGYLFSSINP